MNYTASARTDAHGNPLSAKLGMDFYSTRVSMDYYTTGREILNGFKWVMDRQTTLEQLFLDDKMSVLAVNLKGRGVAMGEVITLFKTKNSKHSVKAKSGRHCFILHGGKIHTSK